MALARGTETSIMPLPKRKAVVCIYFFIVVMILLYFSSSLYSAEYVQTELIKTPLINYNLCRIFSS